jgi:hypothetical protein
MNKILNFRKEKRHQTFIIFSFIFFSIFTISCDQKSQPSGKSESELIKRINAVQQQIMVQGNMSEAEELAISSLCSIISPNDNDDFDNYNLHDGILLKDVENAPIYNGCEGLSEEGTKKCFKESIVKFIKQEFNPKILNILDISEPQQVAAFFKIDENGNVSAMKVRAANVAIQAEIVRVLKKIPEMKPATQNGINAPVICSILVTYDSEIAIEFVYIPAIPEGVVD